jgi:hypothetical protein
MKYKTYILRSKKSNCYISWSDFGSRIDAGWGAIQVNHTDAKQFSQKQIDSIVEKGNSVFIDGYRLGGHQIADLEIKTIKHSISL